MATLLNPVMQATHIRVFLIVSLPFFWVQYLLDSLSISNKYAIKEKSESSVIQKLLHIIKTQGWMGLLVS